MATDTNSPTTREVLAAALCDAVNWSGTWEALHREAQTSWRHRADKVIRELAQREHVVAAIDELEETAPTQNARSREGAGA